MGLYTVAWSMAQVLNVFQWAVVAVLFPKASGRSTEEVVFLTGLATRGYIALTVPAAAGLLLFSPPLLSVIYGPDYTDAVPVFRLLVVATVLSSTNLVLLQAFMALNRPGLVTIEQVAGLSLILPLMLLLLPHYGLAGAGLALIISALIRFILVLISFPMVLKERVPRLWLTREELVSIARRFHKNDNEP
jgi:O-antigen/teichoic acid export membrane protein